MIPFVDLSAIHQPIRQEILKAFEEVFDSSHFVLGKFVEQFEEAFEKYLDIPHVVGVNSGTDALIIALRSLDIGPGDEVITVPNSFFSSVEAILSVGAFPVFVDVEPDTALMDVSQIPQKISPRTKAILPVHLYGQPVSMAPLLETAKKNNLFVVEDACQAHGSLYQGKKAGTLGDVGCFSFYPGKNLGALGDGGALVTRNKKIFEKAKKLRDHGSIQKYHHELVGYNSRLDALQASFLTVKLKYLDGWNQTRGELAEVYKRKLSPLPDIKTFKILPERTSNHHLFVVQVPKETRDSLTKYLTEKGIGWGLHYPIPLHKISFLQKVINNKQALPVAEELAMSVLSLPMDAGLKSFQIEEVISTLKNFYHTH